MECLGQPTGGFSGCLELLELRSEFGVELCTDVYAKLFIKTPGASPDSETTVAVEVLVA